MGWRTMEHLCWNAKGKLMPHAPSTYKIPVANDVPPVFNVKMWESGSNAEDSIYRSKAVGEPPLMLAISVHQAIKDAIASVAEYRASPRLDTPATPEEILHSVEELTARTRAHAKSGKQKVDASWGVGSTRGRGRVGGPADFVESASDRGVCCDPVREFDGGPPHRHRRSRARIIRQRGARGANRRCRTGAARPRWRGATPALRIERRE